MRGWVRVLWTFAKSTSQQGRSEVRGAAKVTFADQRRKVRSFQFRTLRTSLRSNRFEQLWRTKVLGLSASHSVPSLKRSRALLRGASPSILQIPKLWICKSSSVMKFGCSVFWLKAYASTPNPTRRRSQRALFFHDGLARSSVRVFARCLPRTPCRLQRLLNRPSQSIDEKDPTPHGDQDEPAPAGRNR